jgi:putative ABC transport system permease protein
MNAIFGISMNVIMIILVAILALCLVSVAWIAWRRPIIFKLGTRNIQRRKSQTVLIVLGLMLSTLIMVAALGTGDTVNQSITSDVFSNLGHVDELVVSSQQADATVDLSSSVPMDPATLALIEHATADDPNVAGIMPLLEARVSTVSDASQLAEPDSILIGLDPSHLQAFGGLTSVNHRPIDVGSLAPDEVVVSRKLADRIDAVVGGQITVFVDRTAHSLRVAAIAQNSYLSGTRRSFDSSLEYPGLAMSLSGAQQLTNQPNAFTAIAISNSGGVHGGVRHSDAVATALRQATTGQGLGVTTLKKDRVDQADSIGTTFSSIFIVLGMFSVMSGVLLIVLIFTMLASERRAEMGMERAVGTHRRQLIQQFVAEGSVYALVAGMVGAALGVLAAIGLAQGMKLIFGQYAPIAAHITWRSVVVAYSLGMVITFLAVVISSWKISRLNIVDAIRDIPEATFQHRKRSTLLWGSLLVIVGGLLTAIGSGGSSAAAFSIGMSLVPFGVAVLLRFFGVPSRPIFTLVGFYLLAFWLLPQSTFSRLFGAYSFGIEMFFLAGIFMVIGATIIIVQNTDILLRAISAGGGMFRSKLPAIRTGVAYPGAALGRTGLTIAMFSLIIFSLVMMATMDKNYTESALGGDSNAGWDVLADTRTAHPPSDLKAALQATGVDTSDFAAVGVVTNPNEFSSEIRLAGNDVWKTWPVEGVDESFLENSTLKFGQRAVGYATDAAIIQALKTQPNVAVIDSQAVPQDGDLGDSGDNLKLTGLKSSDKSFKPITVELANPRDGSGYQVTIIGVIDSQIGSLSGMFANQKTIDAVYPSRVTTFYFVALIHPGTAVSVSKTIESSLLQSGFQASSIREDLKDAQRQESGFLYIIEGFMGLGLFVGVAAIGVIAFRSVTERRQQIGVLRAIGYRREMVSLSFMIETAFIVGMGVVTGVILGIELTRKLVHDPDQGFSPGIAFVVPWSLIVPIAVLTIGVALLMTWIPARQASNIAPAEALRYE